MPLISSIPTRFKKGFTELATLNDEQMTALQAALSEVPSSAYIEKLVDGIAEKKGLEKSVIEEILTSIAGMIPFLEEDNQIEEIVDDTVAICLHEQLVGERQLSTLRDRLLLLLREKKIFYAAKAEDLLYETENLFISGKIISDIRPIFDLDPEQAPEAGLVMHTLHIHYRADAAGPHQDIYFTLDGTDIQALIAILVRADKKEEALKVTLKKAGMNNLNE